MINKKFLLNNINGVQFYTCPEIGKLPFIKHFFSTKVGGVSQGDYSSLNLGVYTNDLSENVNNNFSRINNAADMNSDNIMYLFQIHGNEFHVIDKNNFKNVCGNDGDAIITKDKNISIGVFTADCVPILIVDSVRKVVAVIHAGWKSTYLNIGKKVIEHMINSMECKPEDIIAALGPSIGPCCFQVGEEVADKFNYVYKKDNGYFVDLWKENANQIFSCGISEDRIFSSNLCTVCNSDMFYSYRRDNGRTGRLGTFIQMI
jgi:polyphenol oxidase